MTDAHDKAEVEKRLWSAIEKQRTGMLGMTGEHADHYQPMTAFHDEGSGTLWFFTDKNADISKAADGGKSMFIFMDKSGELQACLGGTLTATYDRAVLERFWNPIFLNWYPKGKDDPKIGMLRFDADDAAVWISEGGLLKLAFTTLHAAITKEQQDEKTGTRQHLEL